MNKYLLLLIFYVLVSSAAFGQRNPTGRATVIVLADSSVGEMMYLTCLRGPMLDFERVDSARVGADHRAHFSLVPDPMKQYQIQSTAPSLVNRVYLADGDSLIFSYSKSVDSLLFDRIGANQSFRDSLKPWEYSMKLLQKNMKSMDWDSWRAYLDSRNSWFDQKAAWFASKYPKNTGLRDVFKNEEIMQHYNGLASYLLMHYWDSTGKPVVNDPSRLRVLDSVPWSNPSFGQSFELSYTSMFWVNLAWKRWQHEGVDTAGKEYGEEAFLLARKLPPPARDGAILYILTRCTDRYTPEEGTQFVDREYDAYRQIASDTSYLGEYERLRTKFRVRRVAGKPTHPFSLPDTTNKMRSLSEFRGKIVYLDFWGTWCEPCQKEIPSLLTLEKKFENDTNVAFVSIALQSSDYEEERVGPWKRFIAKKGLLGTQLFGEKQLQNETAEAYGISGVPTFMIIGRDGKFIDPDAPRPSSGKAEDAIRAALSAP